MGAFLWECAVFAAILVAPWACFRGVCRAKRAYDRSAGSHAWRHLVVGNLCALLALITLLFAIAECYYRFWYDTTDGLALTRISRSWSKRHFHYNNAGFRARKEYTSTPTADRRRVTFLGDSFAVGYGIARVQDRLSNLVEQRSAAQRSAARRGAA